MTNEQLDKIGADDSMIAKMATTAASILLDHLNNPIPGAYTVLLESVVSRELKIILRPNDKAQSESIGAIATRMRTRIRQKVAPELMVFYDQYGFTTEPRRAMVYEMGRLGTVRGYLNSMEARLPVWNDIDPSIGEKQHRSYTKMQWQYDEDKERYHDSLEKIKRQA